MPPPPLAWHPEQLYQLNSRCPSLIANAFPSYVPVIGIFGRFGPPGCNSLSVVRLGSSRLAGGSRRVRCSRAHDAKIKSVAVTKALLNTGHSVLIKNFSDLRTFRLQNGFDLVA